MTSHFLIDKAKYLSAQKNNLMNGFKVQKGTDVETSE